MSDRFTISKDGAKWGVWDREQSGDGGWAEAELVNHPKSCPEFCFTGNKKQAQTVADALNKDAAISRLEVVFRAAAEAGLAALPGGDGGTCNFDSATFQRSGLEPDLVCQTGQGLGLQIYYRERRRGDMWGDTYFVSLPQWTGQGAMNTRVAEAITNALKTAGLDAATYYQMD
jgi:hypothetical protein